MARPAFPPAPEPIPATPFPELDAAIARLVAGKASWAATTIDERLALLSEIAEGTLAVAADWADLDARAKGAWPGTQESGEAAMSGAVPCMRNTWLLEKSLRDLKSGGTVQLPDPSGIKERADGRLVVPVFPTSLQDRLVFMGYSAEVWMEPGVTRQNLQDHIAGHYKNPDREGKVALVLGAGNQSSIPFMDALYKLFVEGQVVLLKMNPVNEYVGPLFAKVFAPFVSKGWFAVVYGGGDVGAYLCKHPSVDNIHITGSDQTHDLIVWGPKDGQKERKDKGERQNPKEITSELGNVTPILVVPGPWTDREIAFQAENVAAMVENNASFNCIAGKLLVVAKDWDKKTAFLAAVRAALAKTPPRKAFYPGARDRWKLFVDAHPNAEKIGPDSDGVVPWTFIPGLDPEKNDEICFQKEPFCGVLHEVELPAATAVEFLPAAVKFVNERVWGTLACTLLVHPSTRSDPAAEAAFQEALDDLRYGTVMVNHFPGFGYAIVSTTWGAYPGHSLADIQSGRGVVHNTYLFDKPQKSVVYGPFVPMMKPVWFWSHKRAYKLAAPLLRWQQRPGFLRLLPVLPYAMG